MTRLVTSLACLPFSLARYSLRRADAALLYIQRALEP